MKVSSTKNCIKCNKKASIFSGHILSGKEIIICGWCEEHSDTKCPNLLDGIGCFGGWHQRYGLKLSEE